jgi:cation diffusion facilitator CzcD-associated flavoprotein CzcO
MNTDVTIIGAGPYGLSLAAHLTAKGIAFRIFGVPMDFWKSSMPEGMSLKSDGHASSLYDPTDSFTLARYCSEQKIPYADMGVPVTLESFISYGLAFQQKFVPLVEQRLVQSVAAADHGFVLTLDDGESFSTRKLIVAVGVSYFGDVPQPLTGFAPKFVSHSSQHSTLSSFEGLDVAVLGAGASALDLAALLNSVGARPVLIVRGPGVNFHQLQRLPRSVVSRLRAPTSGIGPGWRSWFFCRAALIFHFLPEGWRIRQTKSHAGPAGGWFIREAVVGKVPILFDTPVQEVSIEGERVQLELSNGDARKLTFDHVIAATGYRVNVHRLTFLNESLRDQIATVQDTPILTSNFESSVAGLYFVGPSAANSFGPVQRFAVGAKFAARRVSRHLARQRIDVQKDSS